MSAVCALLALALAGCTQVGTCAQDIRPSPLISVDVKTWVAAHPETNVRVCVGGECTDGYNVISIYGAMPATPFHEGDSVVVTVQPVQGSIALESFTKTARLVDGRCGQWGAQLKLGADGTIAEAGR